MSYENPSALLPSKYGDFKMHVWPSSEGKETIALVTSQLDVTKPVLIRIHSECMTGDVFGSFRCDCGQQKRKALRRIAQSKNGVFIYLRQEGRGIGLSEKIRAYALQEQGYDTHEANILLGHEPDPREYSMVKVVLDQLGVTKIKVLTNNPSKVNSLRDFGFTIVDRLSLKIKSNKFNKKYLETKKLKFKHFYDGEQSEYYFGVTGVTSLEEIDAIANFAKKHTLDPQLRIAIGFSATNSILTDKKQQEECERYFKASLQHCPPIVPILHYSFKKSKNYAKEIEKLSKLFPYVKRILLNDLEKDHYQMLELASKYFRVHFPINDKYLHLISEPQYSKLVKKRHILTVLDNSGGRGIQENIASFEKKITLCLNNGINDIGVAGGFGDDNLETYTQLSNYFKINFSIDAETKLQNNDKLDLKKVESYLGRLILHTTE